MVCIEYSALLNDKYMLPNAVISCILHTVKNVLDSFLVILLFKRSSKVQWHAL